MEKKVRYLFYFLFSVSFLLLVINVDSFVSNLRLIISFIFNPKLISDNINDISKISQRVKMIFDYEKEISS
ncbi:MAG: hypothetical protein ACP5PA_06800, partial [Elusimicrobiales bacterium]